ncbi:MAG: hypothetical protein CM15mP18_3610 [Methanobacteriota archaeon]|nr:MAG: hypothetical protein CM15mP18_3610 [Euryarchaeota archaeon]
MVRCTINSHGLVGLVRGMGHEPYHHPAVEDTVDGLRKALDAAAKDSDIDRNVGWRVDGRVGPCAPPHGRRRRPSLLAREDTTGFTPLFGLWKGPHCLVCQETP